MGPHTSACGFAVRVRRGNCIPLLRRFALRARSAGGIAVSQPSSGCNWALARLGNKGTQAFVHTVTVIYGVARHSKERRTHRTGYTVQEAQQGKTCSACRSCLALRGRGGAPHIAAARRRKRVKRFSIRKAVFGPSG